MLEAKIARAQASIKIKSDIKAELDNIERAIKSAVADGKFEVCIEKYISEEAEKQLKVCGYTIERDTQYNYCYTIIYW